MNERQTRTLPLFVVEQSEGMFRDLHGPPDIEFDVLSWDWDEVSEAEFERLQEEFWPMLQRMDEQTRYHFIEDFRQRLDETYDTVEVERQAQQDYWEFVGVVEQELDFLQRSVEGPVAT